ncbi:ABC transporter ATP-binding protein [Aquibaculum sediminis]|uniref:ABC transporter ATP-binding protein n=1 Tax=Aquibaculum sediminis TaxID=3231907 RepID=UPI0034538237
MQQAAIELSDVSKQFGGVRAVDSVSLTIAPGERRVLIGPNGAGKTTLFNCITGNLPASTGRIVFFGQDLTEEPERSRTARGMGRTFQISNVFTDLSVWENMILARLGCDTRKWRMHRSFFSLNDFSANLRETLEWVRLDRRINDPVSDLSYGERKQLDLALGLAGEPKALFLDEPCAGLSPSERQRVSQLIGELPDKMTVVMIEHDMDIALGLAERVTVLHQGRVILEGAPDEVETNPEVREVYFGAG